MSTSGIRTPYLEDQSNRGKALGSRFPKCEDRCFGLAHAPKRRGCRRNLGADSLPDLIQPLDDTATTNEKIAQEQNTLLAKLYQYAIACRDCQIVAGAE